jgi:NAD(P)-dependent dehydrogenase (short-subunit alcohol dehydrogenase family)
MMPIAGRVVVVTGAATDVGRALALGFAADGAHVIATDADRAALAEVGFAAGGRLLAISADARRDDEVDNVLKIALDRYGHIDALITTPPLLNYGDLLARPLPDWQRVIEVNLIGAARYARAVLHGMLGRGQGRVVMVVSEEAESCTRGASAYAAANAGLIALVKTLGKEVDRVYSPDVLVNALLVGATARGESVARRAPEAAYPDARRLVTLPAAGPTGRLFRLVEEGREPASERGGHG